MSCDITSNGFVQTAGYVIGPSGEQLTETDGQGNWVHTNVFAAGQLLATYSYTDNSHAATDTYFALSDWLGTKRAVVSAGGCGTGYVGLPYGDSLTATSLPGFTQCPDATEHHFTGKERDAESGNDYFGARYYASTMGRFLSPDPLYIEMHRLADPQQLNLYMYSRNNPLTVTDPTGLDITCGGTRCADYLSGLQKDIKGFKIDYDKNGKVETVGDVDKKGLSKSDKAFLSAIDDGKHHVTINAIGGGEDASTFFGASHGATHTINFDQAALLDGPKNAGGMTSAQLVGHETLEGYEESQGWSMDFGHNYAATMGFPGMSALPGGTYGVQNGMVLGITGNFQIQGTNTVETIGTRFVTPIPQADFLKNAKSDHPTASPAYPVSVEKKQ
jgi:RHS repeat-associated protein